MSLNIPAIRESLNICDNTADEFLTSYIAGIFDTLQEQTGLYFDEFTGLSTSETFTTMELCNNTYNIGAWQSITKVEIGSLGSATFKEITEEVNYIFGRLKAHKNVIFEVKSLDCCGNNCFAKCSKLRITGIKGIGGTEATNFLTPALYSLFQELIRSAYNFTINDGIVEDAEHSGNLSIKIDNKLNALNSLNIYSPQLVPQLKNIIKSYKVNYHYPL